MKNIKGKLLFADLSFPVCVSALLLTVVMFALKAGPAVCFLSTLSAVAAGTAFILTPKEDCLFYIDIYRESAGRGHSYGSRTDG